MINSTEEISRIQSVKPRIWNTKWGTYRQSCHFGAWNCHDFLSPHLHRIIVPRNQVCEYIMSCRSFSVWVEPIFISTWWRLDVFVYIPKKMFVREVVRSLQIDMYKIKWISRLGGQNWHKPTWQKFKKMHKTNQNTILVYNVAKIQRLMSCVGPIQPFQYQASAGWAPSYIQFFSKIKINLSL